MCEARISRRRRRCVRANLNNWARTRFCVVGMVDIGKEEEQMVLYREKEGSNDAKKSEQRVYPHA